MNFLEALQEVKSRYKRASSARVRRNIGTMRAVGNTVYTLDDTMPNHGLLINYIVLDRSKIFNAYPTVDDLFADDWIIVYARFQYKKVVLKILEDNRKD